MTARVPDYNRIAASYDERYRHNPLSRIAGALVELATRTPAGCVLEVGCGTGRWLSELRESGFRVFGLDASSGMLSKAAQRLGCGCLVEARANAPPFSGGAFDLIFCVNALHHFDDPQQFVASAAELLRDGGQLAVVAVDPRTVRRHYQYEFFEAALAMDLDRYSSFGRILDLMWSAGLEQVEFRVVETVSRIFRGSDVLEDPFLKKGSSSTLSLIPEDAYRQGLQRIEAAAREGRAFHMEMAFGLISGVKA